MLAYDLPEEKSRLTSLPSDENQENAEERNNPQRHDVESIVNWEHSYLLTENQLDNLIVRPNNFLRNCEFALVKKRAVKTN